MLLHLHTKINSTNQQAKKPKKRIKKTQKWENERKIRISCKEDVKSCKFW